MVQWFVLGVGGIIENIYSVELFENLSEKANNGWGAGIGTVGDETCTVV